ncbi:MAG TPA: glycosyltransferase [Phaeodactylibacter sp.]|nr:glycosyltransferase [Phaeodactylibacter sp.]
MSKKISIIISLYNEEQGILNFWKNLKKTLDDRIDIDFELLWVNDGSTDQTQNLINQISAEKNDKNIKHLSIEFSKNFGHEAAMIAGIDYATGEAMICMDSDGQHPPSAIHEMIAAYQKGNDIVLMERMQREDNGRLKRFFSSFFYKIINALSAIKFQNNSTDFFLISRQVADILRSNYREQNRFIRGFIQSIGFDTAVLPFYAAAREFGESNYSYFGLLRLAFDAIFAFSSKPLRISMFFSVLFILFTIVFSGYSLYMYIYGETPPSGYTTIVLFLSVSFSLLFLTITVLSLYFEKALQEMRQRPLYIVKRQTADGEQQTANDAG